MSNDSLNRPAPTVALALFMCLAILAGGSARAQDYLAMEALQAAEPQLAQINAVSSAAGRLVAVGERGLVLISTDAGTNWQQVSVPSSQTLTAVTQVGELAWAVGHGGVILHSTDGGSSWSVQFDGVRANQQWLEYAQAVVVELEAELAAVEDETLREDMEYALEDAQFAAEDAQKAIETGPVDPFLGIWFADAEIGLAVGAYGMIYRSENGGADWTLSAGGIENIDRFHYYAVEAAADGTLFLSGEAGILYRSTDKGQNWETLDSGYEGSLFGVVATDDAVLTFGLRGNILRSTDNGDSWQTVSSDSQASLYGGRRMLDGQVILVGAGGAMLRGNATATQFSGEVHASRNTFSGIADPGNGDLVLAGMSGIVRVAKGS